MKIVSYVFFFMVLFSLVNISAESNPCGNDGSFLGRFDQGAIINLIQTCDSCTYVNLSTITFPDATQLVINDVMTKNGVNYNYSFSNTTATGCYFYSVYGDKDGTLQSEVIGFEVGQPITLFLILLGVATLLLVLAFTSHNYVFSFFAGISFLVAGVYGMIYGFIFGLQEYTQMVSVIIIGIGAIITIVSSIDLINELSEGGGNDYKDEDYD